MKQTIKILTLTSVALLAVDVIAVDLANVNGKTVTDKDVQTALSGFNEGQRRQILNDSNSKREIVNTLIQQEIMVQEAEKQKLDQDPDYQTALRAFRRQYLTTKLIQKNVAPKVTDASAKKFYALNKRRYSTDKVQVQHILLSDEKAALDIMKQAKAGADFQTLAEKHSRDPSAKNNRGDIGVLTRDSPFVPQFKNAAFDGKKGEIVGPVKTTYGYHVIKIVDKDVGKTLNYEEVELAVKAELQKELLDNYIIQLKKQAAVKADDKAIEKL